MDSKVLIAGCLFILLAFNTMILQKERHLVNGGIVILELAPRDPRSLIQGDYMVLRYKLAEKVENNWGDSGRVFLELDSQGFVQKVHRDPKPGLASLRFRRLKGRVLFNIESFFFQEGQRVRFEKAKYGELKVSPDGIPILVRLLDKNLSPL